MKLIVNELGFGNSDEIFQEITIGDHNIDSTAIRPHLYRHNFPSGSLRVEVRDTNDKVAYTSETINIADISTGNNYFHGSVRFQGNFAFQAGATYRVYLVGFGGYSFSESAYIGWCRDYDLNRYPYGYTPNSGYNSALLMEVWEKREIREGFRNEQDA